MFNSGSSAIDLIHSIALVASSSLTAATRTVPSSSMSTLAPVVSTISRITLPPVPITSRIFSGLIFNCSPKNYECELFDPEIGSLHLKFLDNSNNYLIGYDKLYNPDSIKIFHEDDSIDNGDYYRIKIEDSEIEIYYSLIPNNSAIYLQLSSFEIDTLQISYNYIDAITSEGCEYTKATISVLNYNNEEISTIDGETYEIVK